MNCYPEFARLLNQELQRQDRSASWLAQRLDVSPSTVARWLNHDTRPGTATMVTQIAEALGIATRRQELLVAAGFSQLLPPDAAVAAPGFVAAPSPAPERHVRVPALPRPATPLVGRVAEIELLGAWLADAAIPLVTIVGPGGMGKTRLALAVAHKQQAPGHFAHGVAFIDLAPLSKVEQLPAAMAQAIGLPLATGSEQGRSPEQQIIDFLQTRHMLLVLDNAEHLLEEVDLVANIVAAAPEVRILVTSRAPLRLPAEQLYPLQGLETGEHPLAAGQEAASAMALFLQSARRVRPAYRADAGERQQIAAICQLVEGMPLAIELAASWVNLLAAVEILAAIRQSLHFLETDLRGGPARHRSMTAVFDATWQRLGKEERQVFARLALFRGGFTQDAVKHVAGAGLNQLRTLAASSLIAYDPERSRYTIHELLRQYGALRLAEWPDLERATHEAHSNYYLSLLHRRQDTLKRRGLQTDLQVLDMEAENLNRAWGWAAEHDHIEGLVATLDGLGLYLQWRGRVQEGGTAFGAAAAALRRTGAMRHLVRALAWEAHFARILGQSERATQLLAESDEILNGPSLCDQDNRFERGFVLMQLGAAAAARDPAAAETHYRQSLALFAEAGEQWCAAEALLGLGHVYLTQGNFAGQRAAVQHALDTYRTLGNVRGTAAALSMLADIDSYRGRSLSGLELGFEALAAFRSLGDPVGIATCLARIGMTYMNLGDVTNARQVVDESLALFEEIGSRRDQVIACAFLCAIELMAGDYWQAHTNAERAVAIATTLDDRFVLGVAVGFLGWAQHYVGNLSGALKTLREAVIITRQTGATMDSVRWYSQLGLAQWKNGQGQQARAHCRLALQLAAQVVDAWSMLTAISSTLAILADGEDPVRAVELYAMLVADPLCAASRWFADGVAPHVTAAMKGLPDEVVAAALARGKDLEQQTEVAWLAEEVVGLGWARE